MGEKNKCKVIIKRGDGKECCIPVAECSDDADGCKVIVVRCDDVDAKCCADDKQEG